MRAQNAKFWSKMDTTSIGSVFWMDTFRKRTWRRTSSTEAFSRHMRSSMLLKRSSSCTSYFCCSLSNSYRSGYCLMRFSFFFIRLRIIWGLSSLSMCFSSFLKKLRVLRGADFYSVFLATGPDFSAPVLYCHSILSEFLVCMWSSDIFLADEPKADSKFIWKGI